MMMEVKLFSCPSSAMPTGPMITAITFTLTKPVSIFTSVDIAVRPNTFTSVEAAFFLIKDLNPNSACKILIIK
jgi:hypothetical protein